MVVYQDVWNPEQMLRIIERERVTWTKGSSSFAKDACDAADRAKYDLSSLRCFVSGGAPIPPQLIGRVRDLMGAQLIPCWGSSEVGIATIGRLTDSDEKRASTDGAPVPGVELRVVDDEGKLLPPHRVGHLQQRTQPVLPP